MENLIIKEIRKDLDNLIINYKKCLINKDVLVIKFESIIDRLTIVLGDNHDVVLNLRKMFEKEFQNLSLFKSIEESLNSEQKKLLSLKEKANLSF